jgi:hypothetical protein
LADTSTRLILEALGRAAVEPDGIPLLATKTETGLFPATSKARSLADRCKEDGFLEVVQQEAGGKKSREICVLTERGKQFLLQRSSPRQLIEDFLRVLETRQSEVTRLNEQVDGLARGLSGMKSLLESVLPRLTEPAHGGASVNGLKTSPSANLDLLIGEIKAKLSEWHAAAGTPQDCPLPELFRRLELPRKATIGQFHDALRQLHEDDQIYLHPWTGPLYSLPEPPFALLVGHEVAFYASMR